MIYSMTGFGSGRAEVPNLSVLVEIKSVNHRYLDVHIKIPGEYQNFENVIRQKISTAFKRVRLDVFDRIEYKSENISLVVDEQLVRASVKLLSDMKATYTILGEFLHQMLDRMTVPIGTPA